MITGVLDIEYSAYIENEHEIYNDVVSMAKKQLIKCPICNGKVGIHGTYKRSVIFSETDIQKITVIQVKCKKCKKVHAVLPGFIAPNKQYNWKMIEETLKNTEFPTCPADDSTIRRWRIIFKSNK